jgi:hypothetical protein
MTRNQSLARSLNDLGLAAWFGGSLMGAVGLNQSAARRSSTDQTGAVAGAGWAGWTPVNLAAIAGHLVGATALAVGNTGRIAGQRGVASTSLVKTGFTGAALAATAYARFIGQRVISAEEPAESGTEPTATTSDDVAGAQRQLSILQWLIPVFTGAMIVCDAVLGEQQRPTNVASGFLSRFTSQLGSSAT